MYDDRIQDLEELAEENGKTALIPASNTIIIKEAAEDDEFAETLKIRVWALKDAELTWTENTAEITVS